MKTRNGFMLRNVAGKDIVVAVGSASMDFNGLISLNETGAFLWKLLEEGTDYETLVKAMLAEYDIDKATAEKGVNDFLQGCRNAELIDE